MTVSRHAINPKEESITCYRYRHRRLGPSLNRRMYQCKLERAIYHTLIENLRSLPHESGGVSVRGRTGRFRSHMILVYNIVEVAIWIIAGNVEYGPVNWASCPSLPGPQRSGNNQHPQHHLLKDTLKGLQKSSRSLHSEL
jgi:hypothetical protein